jgi:hypothetical protein
LGVTEEAASQSDNACNTTVPVSYPAPLLY